METHLTLSTPRATTFGRWCYYSFVLRSQVYDLLMDKGKHSSGLHEPWREYTSSKRVEEVIDEEMDKVHTEFVQQYMRPHKRSEVVRFPTHMNLTRWDGFFSTCNVKDPLAPPPNCSPKVGSNTVAWSVKRRLLQEHLARSCEPTPADGSRSSAATSQHIDVDGEGESKGAGGNSSKKRKRSQVRVGDTFADVPATAAQRVAHEVARGDAAVKRKARVRGARKQQGSEKLELPFSLEEAKTDVHHATRACHVLMRQTLVKPHGDAFVAASEIRTAQQRVLVADCCDEACLIKAVDDALRHLDKKREDIACIIFDPPHGITDHAWDWPKHRDTYKGQVEKFANGLCGRVLPIPCAAVMIIFLPVELAQV